MFYRKLYFQLLVILICGTSLLAQQKKTSDSYDFLRTDKNFIMNGDKSLQRFYKKLLTLAQEKTGKVRVLQIGDSHIKPGYVSKVVRDQMQEYFGDGGRGLVATRVNMTANGFFNRYGAFTVSSDDGKKTPFNRMTFFMEKVNVGYTYKITDSVGNLLATITNSTSDDYVSKVDLHNYYGTVTVTPISTGLFNIAQVDGISLENDSPGVVYSSYGVNGASYYFYNNHNFFKQLLSGIKPDLLIVSLGTNDAFDKGYTPQNFDVQLNQLINTVESLSPETNIILYVPSDHFTYTYGAGYVSNPNLLLFRDQIVGYCNTNDFAYWDLFSVMGGAGSMRKWYSAGLSAGDLLHFSPEGYLLQGELLFVALLEGFRGHNF